MSPNPFLTFLASALERTAPEAIARLCWGAPDGFPGLIADMFGPLVVLTVYPPQGAPQEGNDPLDAWVETLKAACGSRPWLLKMRSAGADGFRIARSEGVPMCERLEGAEDGLKFEIGTDVRHDFGIFTDARAARALVRSEAAGHHVLNLFAYTCGFGLASLQGGAASVCNVDPDKDYLAWGKRNAAANGMDFRVIPDTAQAFLRRAVRRKEARGSGEFDFVIADPPAFGVGRDADRLLRLFWPEMAQLLVALSPSKMVLLFNDKYFRERTSVESFVAERFGTNYEASWINARDCGNALGAVCAAYEDDPYYLTPRAVFLRRKVSLDSGALLESEPQ